MQRPTLIRVPSVSVAVSSLPPIYAWPVPVKRAVLSVCIVLCLAAYVAMALGLIGLVTVALELL